MATARSHRPDQLEYRAVKRFGALLEDLAPKAIEYHIEGTETALSRIAKDGRVRRDEAGRWVIDMKTRTRVNGHAAGVSTVKAAPVRPDSSGFPEPLSRRGGEQQGH